MSYTHIMYKTRSRQQKTNLSGKQSTVTHSTQICKYIPPNVNEKNVLTKHRKGLKQVPNAHHADHSMQTNSDASRKKA